MLFAATLKAWDDYNWIYCKIGRVCFINTCKICTLLYPNPELHPRYVLVASKIKKKNKLMIPKGFKEM